MTWYPDIDDFKAHFFFLKEKYPDLEKHHLIGDKEQDLKGIIDILKYGSPIKPLDFWIKTVRFLRDLVSSHPFTEGNHRLAYYSTRIFLRKNGYLLELTEKEEEKFTRLVGDKLAEGHSIRNFKPIAKWLKSKCEKIKKIKKTDENIANLPSKDGNYNIFSRKGDVAYTGEGNIKERISTHKRDNDKHFTHFTYNLEPSAKKRKEIQEKRIYKYNPPLNKQKK